MTSYWTSTNTSLASITAPSHEVCKTSTLSASQRARTRSDVLEVVALHVDNRGHEEDIHDRPERPVVVREVVAAPEPASGSLQIPSSSPLRARSLSEAVGVGVSHNVEAQRKNLPQSVLELKGQVHEQYHHQEPVQLLPNTFRVKCKITAQALGPVYHQTRRRDLPSDWSCQRRRTAKT